MYCTTCNQKVEKDAEFLDSSYMVDFTFSCSCTDFEKAIAIDRLHYVIPDNWEW